jgi:hypothetical protein
MIRRWGMPQVPDGKMLKIQPEFYGFFVDALTGVPHWFSHMLYAANLILRQEPSPTEVIIGTRPQGIDRPSQNVQEARLCNGIIHLERKGMRVYKDRGVLFGTIQSFALCITKPVMI